MFASGSGLREDSKESSSWTSLKQQTLPAWQPIYTTKTVSPIFFFFGIILVPLGVVVFHVSENIQEIRIDYTDCFNSIGQKCADIIRNRDRKEPCNCLIDFVVPHDLEGEIHLYYGLTNFYQNHREYVKSKDDDQLLGRIVSPLVGSLGNLASPTKDCQPFGMKMSRPHVATGDPEGRIVFPCGAIANSMFNDTINLLISDGSGKRTNVNLIRKGIAWETDRKYKFKNPKEFGNKDDPIWTNFVSPRDWNRTLWDLDPNDPENNGLQNEDFMVWMRTAALPNFRKLYRIIDSKSLGLDEREGLRKGNYSWDIKYEFEVQSFDGTKSIILTEVSRFIGGRNSKLGIVFMTAGSVVMFLGLLFLLGYVKRKKSGSRGRSGKRQDYGTCRSGRDSGNKID